MKLQKNCVTKLRNSVSQLWAQISQFHNVILQLFGQNSQFCKFVKLQTAVSQHGLVSHLWSQFRSFATQFRNLAPHFHNFAKIAKLRTTVSQVVANLCSCETEKKSRNKVVNMPLRGVKVCFIPFIRFLATF